MDLSKLPRLSKTDARPSQGPDETEASTPPSVERASGAERGQAAGYFPPPSFAAEAWISITVGLVLLFFFPTFLQYASSKVFHTRFAPYPDGNGNWFDYATMTDGTTIPYRQTKPLHSPNYWSDVVVTLFALALLLEGATLAFLRRPAAVALTLLLTLAAVLANLAYFIHAYKETMPVASMLAVIIGGYMVFVQWQLLQYGLFAAKPPKTKVVGSGAAPPDFAARHVDPAQELVGKMLGGEPKARCTHYRFAHQALRQAAFENPAKCLGLLQGPGAQRFLLDLWEAVQSGCAQAGQPGGPGPEGLEADMTQVGPYSSVIVRMPEPRFATEAHFVAMVLRAYARLEDGLTIERHPLLLYYTLEQAAPAEAGHDSPAVSTPPRTALCEWQGGVRVNYGDGPPPDAAAFREAIHARVNALQQREDAAAGVT